MRVFQKPESGSSVIKEEKHQQQHICSRCKNPAFDTESASVQQICSWIMGGHKAVEIQTADRHPINNGLKQVPCNVETYAHPQTAGSVIHVR